MRQIRIQEPILAVHLYPAGQYSLHKITPDNHKWWHESTNFWIRHQRSECKKPNAVVMGTLGQKFVLRISHLIIQHMTKLFILSSILGRSQDLVIPEASFDPDFEMLPAVHPGGA